MALLPYSNDTALDAQWVDLSDLLDILAPATSKTLVIAIDSLLDPTVVEPENAYEIG